MRPADAHGTVAGQGGLAATEVGDAVHRLLELVDLAAPAAPDVEQVAWLVSGGDRRGVGADRARFVASYCGSELARADRRAPGCAAGAAVRVRARRRTAARAARRPPPGRRAGARRSTTRRTRSRRGRPRRSSRPTTGCNGWCTPSRASAPGRRRSRSSTTSSSSRMRSCRARSRARDVPALEAELSEAIGRIRAGEFVPTPSEFICAGCPALDVVCAGPRLRGGPSRPQAARRRS